MSASAHDRTHSVDPASFRGKDALLQHYQTSEHLANERTHLAYVTTSIALISLGIAINRSSVYVLQKSDIQSGPSPIDLLRNIAQLGVGMVLFGFGLMVLALHRFLRVERAIDRDDFRSQRRFIEGITLTTLFGGALSIIWIFLR